MKYVLALVTILLAAALGMAWWLFADAKWSAYRWDKYVHQANCIAAKLPGQKDNRLALQGEGDTAAYTHGVSVWNCGDGRTMAMYDGLPDTAPRKLFNEDLLRYRNGLVGDDDSRRFVTPEEIARLKSIKDWQAMVAAHPF